MNWAFSTPLFFSLCGCGFAYYARRAYRARNYASMVARIIALGFYEK
jgi:hypothetical protein